MERFFLASEAIPFISPFTSSPMVGEISPEGVEVVTPKTPGANPTGIPAIKPPAGVADNSLEKSPGAQPLPALILK